MKIKLETHTYKTVGDCRIYADVYRPSDSPVHTSAIVYIHGGCLIYGSRTYIDPRQLALYLEAGYAVISVDYRLAPETKLPGIIEDLQDAFRWLRDHGPDLFAVDPGQIAVVGHSAGGYLALMAGCCVVPCPRAVVSFYGYGDIVGDWYSKPDSHYLQQPRVLEEEVERFLGGPVISERGGGHGMDKFYLYCRQNGLWPQEVGGRDPEEDASFFVPYCPVKNVSADYPATLLLHGDEDTDVPCEQSVQMSEALARHQVMHELISLPGKGHGFDQEMDEPEVQNAFSTVLAFLDTHPRAGRA